jgi:hypothetical protein
VPQIMLKTGSKIKEERNTLMKKLISLRRG